MLSNPRAGRCIAFAFAATLSFAAAVPAFSQDAATTAQDAKDAKADKTDPTKRPLSDRELLKQRKAAREELSSEYKTWLDRDVVWIITEEERKAFKSLSNNEERDAFIETFWQRRNPSPDSPENEYREEHYRRIEYANEHFASGKPGSMTDRGHIYIAYGPPDEREQHPSGGPYHRPMEEGGGDTTTYPFEQWTYHYIEGLGDNIQLEFVDVCGCNEYHYTIDRSEKDALLHSSGGQTEAEELGLSSRQQRFTGSGLEQLGAGPLSSINASKQFDRVILAAKIMGAPPVKFKDMEQFLTAHKLLTGPVLPFDVRTDYVRVTNDTVLVPITIQIRDSDISYKDKNGVSRGPVNILGRLSTISGHIAQTFEDVVDDPYPTELKDQKANSSEIYWKAVPLRPGTYRLDIVLKDVNNPDKIGQYSRSVVVPKFDDDRVSTSSLILADKMEHVATKQIGTGQFIIGNTFIRPRVSGAPAVPVAFKRDQKLSFWMQVYNLGIDDKTKQNGATIDYSVVDMSSNKEVLNQTEQSAKLSPNSDQITLEKSMPLSSLQPGKYQVVIKVNDGVSRQQLAQSAPFIVE